MNGERLPSVVTVVTAVIRVYLSACLSVCTLNFPPQGDTRIVCTGYLYL